MKKIILSLVLIFGLLFGSINVFAKINIELDPLKFKLEGSRGDIIIKKIKIINKGNKETSLRIGKNNITQKENGNIKIINTEKENIYPEQNIIEWININEKQINIKPGEIKEINFSIKIPKNGEIGGHYGLIYFKTIKKYKDINIILMYGIPVLLTVKGKKDINLKIDSIKLSNKKNKIYFNISIINSGNTYIVPKGKIILFDENGKQLKQIGEEKIINSKGKVVLKKIVDYIPINNNKTSLLHGVKKTYKVKFKGLPYYYINYKGEKEIKYNTNILNKKLKALIILEENNKILDKKILFINGFSNLIKTKNKLKNTEFEKYISFLDKILEKKSKEKLLKLNKNLEKLDFNSEKLKKFKDLLIYIKLKIKDELEKRS